MLLIYRMCVGFEKYGYTASSSFIVVTGSITTSTFFSFLFKLLYKCIVFVCKSSFEVAYASFCWENFLEPYLRGGTEFVFLTIGS